MKKFKIQVYETTDHHNGPATRYDKPKIVKANDVSEAFQKALRLGFRYFGGNTFWPEYGTPRPSYVQRVQYGQFARGGSTTSNVCCVEAVELDEE